MTERIQKPMAEATIQEKSNDKGTPEKDKEKRPREATPDPALPEETAKRRELDSASPIKKPSNGFSAATGFGALSSKGSIFDTTSKEASSSNDKSVFGGFSGATGFSSFSSLAKQNESTFSSLLGQEAQKEPEQTEDEEENEADSEQYIAVRGLQKQVVPTGEEEDRVIHTVRAKLYAIDPKSLNAGWKERGPGALKVLETTYENNRKGVRLVMRVDGSLRVILNMPLLKFSKVEDGGESMGEKTIRVFGIENGIGTWIAIRVLNKAMATELKGIIQDGINADTSPLSRETSTAEEQQQEPHTPETTTKVDETAVPAKEVTDLPLSTPVAVHAVGQNSIEDSVEASEVSHEKAISQEKEDV